MKLTTHKKTHTISFSHTTHKAHIHQTQFYRHKSILVTRKVLYALLRLVLDDLSTFEQIYVYTILKYRPPPNPPFGQNRTYKEIAFRA